MIVEAIHHAREARKAAAERTYSEVLLRFDDPQLADPGALEGAMAVLGRDLREVHDDTVIVEQYRKLLADHADLMVQEAALVPQIAQAEADVEAAKDLPFDPAVNAFPVAVATQTLRDLKSHHRDVDDKCYATGERVRMTRLGYHRIFNALPA